MRKIALIFFFIQSLVFSISSQETIKPYQFGIHVAPKKTTYRFQDADKSESKSQFGIEAGVDFFYHLSKKLTLKSGLSYHFLHNKQIDYSITFGSDIDFTNSGSQVNLQNSWFEDDFKAHYVGLPIELRFKLLGNENHLYTKLGLELLWKFAGSEEIYLIENMGSASLLEMNPTRKLNRTLTLVNYGIGYQIKLSNRQFLYLESQINYSTKNIFQSSSILNNSKILNLGLAFGVGF